MADYIYLLENRLSAAQRSAVRAVRELARAKGLTSFLVGGAVRDLTSGSPVRDLDVVVQGNASKLRKEIERAGGVISGEYDPTQSLFVRFPGAVRMEVSSTLSITFPKPGKPVARPATILEDLRRRDFTANAMALSLNEGSYGLLMDPLNGVADIENRQLRLVSNYGFIEDPVRMIRAARLMARLGWTLDERTEARYETGKAENYIAVLSDFHRGYETEELVHEEDPLRVMRRLEAEGWMKVLAPYWNSSKVNVAELERLRETQTQMQMQGIQPGTAAASFPMLTAKLSPKEIATLKAGFPRQGFVAEIDALDAEGKEFAARLGSKEGASPSGAWKLITSAAPEAVLWVAFSSKSAALQNKFKGFYNEWPQARTRIPYALMHEMRIVPELPVYNEVLEKLFFELMDGHLTTPEEMKAFLEPYSPPAPPPPVSLRRPRAAKKETKSARAKAKKADAAAEDVSAGDGDAGEQIPVEGETGSLTAKPEAETKASSPARPAPAKPVTPKPEKSTAGPAGSGAGAKASAAEKATAAELPVAQAKAAAQTKGSGAATEEVAGPAGPRAGGKASSGAKSPGASKAAPSKTAGGPQVSAGKTSSSVKTASGAKTQPAEKAQSARKTASSGKTPSAGKTSSAAKKPAAAKKSGSGAKASQPGTKGAAARTSGRAAASGSKSGAKSGTNSGAKSASRSGVKSAARSGRSSAVKGKAGASAGKSKR